MTRQEANKVLNLVREGISMPYSEVLRALVTTGDLNGHLDVDNSVSNWPFVRSTAPSSPVLLPDVEG